MRKSLLCSLTALLAGAGVALAGHPAPSPYKAAAQSAEIFAGQLLWAEPRQPVRQVVPIVTSAVSPEQAPAADFAPAACPAADCPPTACPAADCPPAASPVADCAPAACPDREPCGPAGRVWVDAEYLMWWIKDSRLPVLVSGGTVGSGGILPFPGAVPLFGGGDVDNELRQGGRFTAGAWLNDCHTLGVEGSYFFLGERAADFTAGGPSGPGAAVIARPFFNLTSGMPDAQAVVFPGVLGGSASVASSSRLQGAEANGIVNLCCGCEYRLDLLAGFRFADLDEGLGITEDLTVDPAFMGLGGTRFGISDRFTTGNDFYGGQIGARAELRREKLFVNVVGKVALGVCDETVDIRGSTAVTLPGGLRVVGPGGLLALPSNSGLASHDRFAVLPELGVNVGYQVTKNLRAHLGYTFLYWSDVVRPGDQIDPVLNTLQVPRIPPSGALLGPGRPAPLFRTTDFWSQGINFGLELRF